jgi:hypothetical protein
VAERFTIRKSGGDDMYSWALFDNGRELYNGMSRSEAQWRRDTARAKAKEAQK